MFQSGVPLPVADSNTGHCLHGQKHWGTTTIWRHRSTVVAGPAEADLCDERNKLNFEGQLLAHGFTSRRICKPRLMMA
ncbi:hypothetical protein QC763_0054740 [Podospora pseudopauciseta]|uniref:Uncharacterized protein n=1 Tax=Podospora pseudopauciseta TaxID=2093780 RepID=A0ABR0HGY0_9PEZI|nr:hypothetical protein QC763_0054740 [Podospora pseudopauciseta]